MPAWRTTSGDACYFHPNAVIVVLLTMMLLLILPVVVVDKVICQPGEQLLLISVTFILVLPIVLLLHCVAHDTDDVMSLLAVIAQWAMPTILLLILTVNHSVMLV